MVVNALDKLRQPEYTGENRCTPCTVLNLVIAAVLAAVVSIGSTPLGVAIFVLSVGLIHLRGYLVPGTPTITARYFPEPVLRLFGKAETEADVEVPDDELTSVDIEQLLLDSGVVEMCDDVDDICLTDGFRESWENRIDTVRESGHAKQRRILADSIEVSDSELSFEQKDDRLAVNLDDDWIASWVSNAAFLADLTAESELEIWCDGWDSMTSRDRSRTIATLRVFLEDCPSCGGSISPIEDNVDTCCRKNLVNVTLECESCGDVIFEGSYR